MRKRMLRVAVISLLSFMSGAARAAAPVLYFSDLTSGPKTGLGDGLGSGAIVTIWGVNLGGARGTSKVYVGDVEAAHVYEWANATQHAGHPADLYTYHKMQTIAFSVPAVAVDGANTIKVVVNGVASNTLPFTVRAGNIYWAATAGNNANSGSFSSPWRDPGYFFGSSGSAPGVAAGDILYCKNGVQVTDSTNGGYGVELYRTGGTASLPYFVAAYPGASVLFQGVNKGFGSGYNMGLTGRYGHISKITLKAASGAYTFIEYGRTIACEITDHPTSPCATNQSGLITSNGAPGGPDYPGSGINGNVFTGNYVHDYCNGLAADKQQHTMYISNRFGRSNAAGWEVGWNYFNNNWGNFGIHVYDEGTCTNWGSPTSIHDNVVVDQRGAGIDIGPGCASGYGGPITTTFNVYNNLVLRGGRGPGYMNNTTSLYAMSFGGSSGNGLGSLQQYTINAYNNTVYAAGEPAGGRDITTMNPVLVQGNIAIGSAFGAISLKNNIIYDTNNYPWTTAGGGTPATASNNIWYSTTTGHAGPPAWDTAPLTANPLLTNPAGADFHLQAGSPALDAGANLGSVVAQDLDGIIRPQGAGFDIGAYEWYSAPEDASPVTPTGLEIR